MSSKCEPMDDLDYDMSTLVGESAANPDREAPGAASPSFARFHCGNLVIASFVTALLTLMSVCGMALLLHHDVTIEDWLTGLSTASLVAGSMIYAGRTFIRQMERGHWDLIASEERIRLLAHYDAVTGLPNRILLKDRVRKELSAAARHRTPLAFLFLDLDRFKSVNDSLGHQAGDELLRIVGERLEESLRDVDTVARLGGDEFVVMLPQTDAAGAAEVAEKIRFAVAQTYRLNGRQVSVTPSIGISMYPDDGLDMDTLMRNADTAMYRAKQDGSNTYRFFRPRSQPLAQRQMTRERDILRALRGQEFAVHYQPQIDARSGNIVAVDAQLGWNHPDKGLLTAREFLPIAAACDLLSPLGEWYFHEASSQLATWHALGLLKAPMVIHLSRQQVRHPLLVPLMQRVFLRSGSDPRDWELELSESSLNDIPGAALARLLEFTRSGMRFTVNEFGTSHGSLAYLKKLPVEKLKIEPTFIQGLPRNQFDAIIVASMIDLAHNLNKKFVADGVASPVQLKFLQSKGCDIVQGPLNGIPADADAFTRSLQTTAGRQSDDSQVAA